MERRSISGFTLIELMIVVAIVTILTMVALPSYRDYVVRSNRSAVQQFMLEIANREERYLLDNRTYTNSLANLGWASEPDEVDDNYNVTVNTPTSTTYTITATAIGSQDSDDTDCGNLTLDSTGAKGSEHGGSRCWR